MATAPLCRRAARALGVALALALANGDALAQTVYLKHFTTATGACSAAGLCQ